ncbi:MAG: hypothetical protein FWD74_09060, partial [Actinomycetia bacterium]|nr:hypothetical protein [Actinomycetes bacterium]
LLARFRWQATIFAVLPALLLIPTNVAMLVPIAVIVGSGIAPALITTFGVVERAVPAAVLTEGMAWTITGMNLGYGLAAAIAGPIADAAGARPAFAVCVAFGATVGLVAWAGRRRLEDAVSRLGPGGAGEGGGGAGAGGCGGGAGAGGDGGCGGGAVIGPVSA